jgi:hypothetical protein
MVDGRSHCLGPLLIGVKVFGIAAQGLVFRRVGNLAPNVITNTAEENEK